MDQRGHVKSGVCALQRNSKKTAEDKEIKLNELILASQRELKRLQGSLWELR